MANRRKQRQHNKEHKGRAPQDETQEYRYMRPLADKSNKYKKVTVNRTKQFKDINALKERILQFDSSKNATKRDEYLAYLIENQNINHALLAKSLCDLASKSKCSAFKIDLLSKAVELDFVDTVTLNSYATALANVGESQKAFEYFEKSLKIDDENTVTLSSYATALANVGESQKAFEYFEKSLKIDDENTVTLNSYATALANVGESQKAFEYFEKSLKIGGENTVTLSSYAMALANVGESQKAFEYFEKSLKIGGEDTVTLNSYATALANVGESQKAFEYFEKSLKIDGENTVTLSSYATALANVGESQKAFEYFEKSLKIDDENTVTLNSYATALANVGESQKAFEYFEKSLKIGGENTVTLSSYAMALANVGESQKAFEYFEKSLKIGGEDTVTLNSYATALANVGESQKAFEYFEKSLKIDDENTVTLNSYATALANVGESQKAFEYFEKSLKIGGEDTVTLNSYATALANVGESQKAFEYFEKSLKIGGEDIVTIFSYGIALKNYRMYDKAIRLFESQIEGRTGKKEKRFLYIILGELYFKNKQQSIGKSYFDKYIKIAGDTSQAKMRSALTMFESNPYDSAANELLLEVAKEDNFLSNKAYSLLTITTPQELFFKYFNAKPEFANQIDTLKELNSAIYHKIENQLVILKDILDATAVSDEEIQLKSVLNRYVLNLFDIVDYERKKEKETQTLDKTDYRKLLKIISEIAHNITDKVNNKLFVISSELNLNDKNDAKNFANFKNQIDILTATLNNLKDIEQGSIEPHFALFRLDELLNNFSQDMKIGNSTIRFKIESGTINSDKQKISEILNELIENSSRHNKDLPNVSIDISIKTVDNPKILTEQKMGKYLVITYCDDGRGIPNSRKEWIFNPLNSTMENGSGLGLFIIKRTVEKLNGRIYEDGEKGVRFRMFIPDKLNTQG